MWESYKEVYILFTDFQKAYYSVNRDSLLNILRQFDLPQKLVSLIKARTLNMKIKIKIGNVTSQGAQVTTELRRRDALSPCYLI